MPDFNGKGEASAELQSATVSLVGSGLAWIEWGRAKALADAAAVATANNVPLIATAPYGTPEPGWITPGVVPTPPTFTGAPMTSQVVPTVAGSTTSAGLPVEQAPLARRLLPVLVIGAFGVAIVLGLKLEGLR